MISSCPDYLHADVSDGQDVSRHQQEVTDGQLVRMSLVPSTIDSDVVLECHLCWTYVVKDVGEGSVESCLEKYYGKSWGGVSKND